MQFQQSIAHLFSRAHVMFDLLCDLLWLAHSLMVFFLFVLRS